MIPTLVFFVITVIGYMHLLKRMPYLTLMISSPAQDSKLIESSEEQGDYREQQFHEITSLFIGPPPSEFSFGNYIF